jgi:hypothetical protein
MRDCILENDVCSLVRVATLGAASGRMFRCKLESREASFASINPRYVLGEQSCPDHRIGFRVVSRLARSERHQYAPLKFQSETPELAVLVGLSQGPLADYERPLAGQENCSRASIVSVKKQSPPLV